MALAAAAAAAAHPWSAAGGGAGFRYGVEHEEQQQQQQQAMDELEEGEASEANDCNYGTDLYFPHLEDKLTEVLGHARKDFEGGIYADKLGSKFGGYGTFLPTVPTAAPPAWGGRRSSPSTQHQQPQHQPQQQLPQHQPQQQQQVHQQQVSGGFEAVKAADGVKPASPKPAPEPSSDAKKASSITLRIKMGRSKNTDIYNKLGFSSPSVSEDDEDGMSGSESSPEYRSPSSMIQVFLSHRIPPEGLLSPLPDLLPSPHSRSVIKEEPRKQIRIMKSDKELFKEDMELVRQKERIKNRDDAGKTAKSMEYVKPAEVKASARKELSAVAITASSKQTLKTQQRRDDEGSDIKAESHLEKRKAKDADVERLKKKHKSNSSTENLDSLVKKSRKQADDSLPSGISGKSKEERKKPVKAPPQSKAVPDSRTHSAREDKVDEPGTKVRGGKLKTGKRNKDGAEAFGREPLDSGLGQSSEIKYIEPPVLPPPVVNPELGAPVPPLAIIKENWVECDDCKQWRLLPPTMDPPKQSDRFFCEMITWLPPGMNSCKYSEETTTAALYRSLGIQHPLDPSAVPPAVPSVVPPAAPPLAVPVADMGRPKKAEEQPSVKVLKPGKQVIKKKEKSKPPQLPEADIATISGEVKDKLTKKKRVLADEGPAPKKQKADEAKQQRHLLDEDVESAEKIRKTSFKPDESKPSKREKERKHPDAFKAEEEMRDEQKEMRRSVNDPAVKKSSRPDKTSKGKPSSRVVDDAENQVKPRSSSRPTTETPEQRRKKGVGSCSPQVASPCDSLDVFRSRAADSSAELRLSDGAEFQVYDKRNTGRGSHDAESQKKTSDQTGDGDHEPFYRVKQGKDVIEQQPKDVRKDHRRAALDCLEAKNDDRKDASSLASSCIKAATNLKHTADRLKDETATDIYLQAALKFLQGAALMESDTLYNETAILFKYCASQYERVNDMAGAVLAYKCAAVARFRLLAVKTPAMSKDRADIQAGLHRAPAQSQATPLIGESPSSSSASDLDNLNSVEKMFTNNAKGAVSPLVQGSGTSVPPTIQPILDRYLRSTGDIFEAFEIWSKAEALLANLVAAKVLSSEMLAAVERVGSIGFNDVEALVRFVNHALQALGR